MDQATDALTPASLAVGLFLGILLLVLPRRSAVAPLLLAGCYMTLGQSLTIGGLHLYLIRILILFGMARIVLRREFVDAKPSPVDKILVTWLLVSSLLYVIVDGRYVQMQERLGYIYDAAGVYALVRALIRDFDDVVHVARISALIIIPLAAFFAFEASTGRNPFAVLGGVPAYTTLREGKLRCQGPFKHPILAGTFGATSMPLFVGLWVCSKRDRAVASIAFAAATVIVMTSRSSGAFSAYFLSLIGFLCWSCRAHMRLLRWGIVLTLIGLAMVMNAPIWFLIDRFSELVGGDGWYRSKLIDSAVNHFGEWWLIGTGFTAHWMETGIPGNPYSADIVNEFVNQGIRGGMLALGLFIWLLTKCFSIAGEGARHERHEPRHRFVAWTLGCAVLSHVASFFSVTYYDQIIIFWYMLIAMLAAIAGENAAPVMAPSAARPVQVSGPAVVGRFAHYRGTVSRRVAGVSRGTTAADRPPS
jgi:hypothetical protein